ncbi:MAG: SRPBCC family protein [Bacteroidota bacterium]|nr:SRPBCC family protein [Bacteroidota bacterium]
MISEFKKITVEATVDSPVEKVWHAWTNPQDIMKWCNASEDWHVPNAENDIRTGGTFLTRMESKDGQFGFDFGGVYEQVDPNEKIIYILGDGRKVDITFEADGQSTKIIETFDAENEHTLDMQRDGWQAILDNFKKYTESKN